MKIYIELERNTHLWFFFFWISHCSFRIISFWLIILLLYYFPISFFSFQFPIFGFWSQPLLGNFSFLRERLRLLCSDLPERFENFSGFDFWDWKKKPFLLKLSSLCFRCQILGRLRKMPFQINPMVTLKVTSVFLYPFGSFKIWWWLFYRIYLIFWL